MMIEYTHPDVLTVGVRDGWADPETDPTRINWAERQQQAVIPFRVVNHRPLNPFGPTGIRFGRNELGHWGEQICADAAVTATDEHGHRWLVMVERRDGYGWALPGGTRDGWEDVLRTAIRELEEETTLTTETLYAVMEMANRSSESDVDELWESAWQVMPARYVPDPRASDEAWMVTVPVRCHLGTLRRADIPAVTGADDAKRAAWVRADTYAALLLQLAEAYDGDVFPAHRAMLADLLG